MGDIKDDKIDNKMDDEVGYADDPKGIIAMESSADSTIRPLELPVCDNVDAIVMRYRSRAIPCRSVKQTLVDSQTPVAFNLLALLILSHIMIPKARVYTRPYFELSHYNDDTGLYAIGRQDFYFITFFFILFTGLRHAIMSFALCPMARRCGISKKKDVARFSEQAWNVIHYSVFWPLGLYIWYTSPYYLNMAELWTNWPGREISGTMKFYFLTQWAFWLQQMLVVHIEKQRKDYWLTIVHHVVTIGLVAAAYSYHFTCVGNLTLIIMDVVDIIFPLAKCAKYLGYRRLCDCLFGIFVVIWLATRHVFFLMVIHSVYYDTERLVPYACFQGSMSNLQGPLPQPSAWSLFEPFHSPQGMICANGNIFTGFFIYLVVLQGLMVIWSYAILKVAVRVLRGRNAEDIRSEDEDEDEAATEMDGKDPAEFEPFDYWARIVYEGKPKPKLKGRVKEGKEEEEEEEEAQADDGAVDGWECHNGQEKENEAQTDNSGKVWERHQVQSFVRGGISSGLHLSGQSEHKELLSRIRYERQVD
ncbi:longevity assurance proteins LAG1/LAC1 [Trichoderma barbatum]